LILCYNLKRLLKFPLSNPCQLCSLAGSYIAILTHASTRRSTTLRRSGPMVPRSKGPRRSRSELILSRKFLAPSAGLAMSRWDGDCGDRGRCSKVSSRTNSVERESNLLACPFWVAALSGSPPWLRSAQNSDINPCGSHFALPDSCTAASQLYSITSSARASTVGVKASPIARAATRQESRKDHNSGTAFSHSQAHLQARCTNDYKSALPPMFNGVASIHSPPPTAAGHADCGGQSFQADASRRVQ
jgi:hypothetical protein